MPDLPSMAFVEEEVWIQFKPDTVQYIGTSLFHLSENRTRATYVAISELSAVEQTKVL
jgi:hypothetical protein